MKKKKREERNMFATVNSEGLLMTQSSMLTVQFDLVIVVDQYDNISP